MCAILAQRFRPKSQYCSLPFDNAATCQEIQYAPYLFLCTQFDTIDIFFSFPRRDHPPADVDAGGSAEAAEDLLVGQLPQPQLARVPDPGGRVQLCGEFSQTEVIKTITTSAKLSSSSDRLCDGLDLPEQRVPLQLDQPLLPHERQGDGQRHTRDGGQPLHQIHRGQEGHTAEAHTGA